MRLMFGLVVLLARILFRMDTKGIARGTDLMQRRLDNLGSTARSKRIVAAVFTGVALLWVTRPLLEVGGLLLFVLPVDGRTGTFVLHRSPVSSAS